MDVNRSVCCCQVRPTPQRSVIVRLPRAWWPVKFVNPLYLTTLPHPPALGIQAAGYRIHPYPAVSKRRGYAKR